MTDTFVKSFTYLKHRPKSDRALPFLQRVASLVKPIMRKHGWVLPLLAEFFPDEQNLVGLNVNGGQKILLRLRPASAPDTFYEEEEVVMVMLHELTHNVHGPHDEKFYKYLAGLEDEYDALKRSGYAGEGFFSKGHRLGMNVSHDLPPHLARVKAVEAAERRRRIGGIMSSGGKLGGKNAVGMSPRELAAQAAERRARDNKACGSSATAQREAAKAAQESIEHKVIDLHDSDEDVVIVNQPAPGPSQKPQARVSAPAPKTGALPMAGSRDRPRSNLAHRSRLLDIAPTEWSCPTCTLLNDPSALQCNACLSTRPVDLGAGWSCMTCGEAGMPHEFWTCSFCGTVKVYS